MSIVTACFGAEDHLNRPACAGDDVRQCRFRAPKIGGGFSAWHSTRCCADCRSAAEVQGYIARIGGAISAAIGALISAGCCS